MPTVPRADQGLTPSAPLPGVRLPTDVPSAAFGVPEGIDLTGVEQHVKEIAQDARHKADEIALTHAHAAAADLETNLLYDPKTGALNQHGANAFDTPTTVAEGWQKGIGDIVDGLSTDQQRLAFQQAAEQRRENLLATVHQHVAGEIRNYDEQGVNAAVNKERDATLVSAVDQNTKQVNAQRIQAGLATQRAVIAAWGRRMGAPADVVSQRILDASSQIHLGVIDQLLNTDQDIAAKAYFQQTRDQIAGDHIDNVEKALQEGTSRGESQRQSDAILKKARTLSEAVEMARQITDPKVRQLTQQNVEHDFAIRDNDLREQRERMMTSATNVVEQTHDFNRVPPSLVAMMTVDQRKSLRDYAVSLQKGTPPVTNWNLYYDLSSRASAEGTRDAFLREDLTKYRPQLGDAEFKQLTETQASLRKGDATAVDRVEAARQIDATIRRSLEAVNINVSAKPGTTDAEQVDQFYRQFKTAKSQLEATTGKAADEDQIRGIIDNLLVRHVTDHWWQGNGPRAFESKPGDELTLTATDVPYAERRKIEGALRSRGLPVTPDRVIGLYRQKLRGMRSGGQ